MLAAPRGVAAPVHSPPERPRHPTHERLLRHRLRPAALHPALRPPGAASRSPTSASAGAPEISPANGRIRSRRRREEPDLPRPPAGDRRAEFRRSRWESWWTRSSGARSSPTRRRGGSRGPICIEKSGQAVFDFEYGAVRWVNAHPLPQAGHRQGARPAAPRRSRWPTPPQQLTRLQARLGLPARPRAAPVHVRAAGAGDDARGTRKPAPPTTGELRPGHMVRAIHMIQDFGIEPDIWKIEGVDRAEDAERVAAAVRSGPGRERVGSIVLGRGSDAAQVARMAPGGRPGGRLHRVRGSAAPTSGSRSGRA